MKKTQIIILLSTWLIFILGCEEVPLAAVNPDPAGPRLKISDLAPSEQNVLSIQCAFTVIVYRIPLDKIQWIPESLSMLSRKALVFSDSDGFAANDFWAASGIQTLGPEVITAITQLGAERIGIKKLLLFEDYPEEIAGFTTESGQSVFYFQADGMLAGKRVPNGRLSLALRGRPDTPRKGFATMQIDSLFQPSLTSGLSVPSGKSLFEAISIREVRFQTTLAEGDFVVLAATKIQQEINTLSHFFVDIRARQPSALLYLIICQQAGAL